MKLKMTELLQVQIEHRNRSYELIIIVNYRTQSSGRQMTEEPLATSPDWREDHYRAEKEFTIEQCVTAVASVGWDALPYPIPVVTL